MKKIILLIGVVMILLVINVNACPYFTESKLQIADHVMLSNYTDILMFGYSKNFVIIHNYTNVNISYYRKTIWTSVTGKWEYQFVNLTLPFLNSTNQKEMNMIYLTNTICSYNHLGYNFGKVTYHEKAISGTHWY